MPRKKPLVSAVAAISPLDRGVAFVQATDGQVNAALAGLSEVKKFGSLTTFTRHEYQQLNSLRDLISRYIGLRSATRPLCLAVFGPPGSGKSFSVKQIRAEVEASLTDSKVRLPFTTINLTQVSYSIEVGRVVARIAGESDDGTVPIIFFDEFDAAREGAAYGWLSWFLAPMHDGEFLHEGAVIRLRRAIYVFAGGTASTMQEFSDQAGSAPFRAAKGPDFISRLRGFLDVQGPNADPRPLRRALLLRNELSEQAKRDGNGTPRLAEELLRSLLSVGRFRYGARSIAAVIEMSDLKAGGGHLSWDHLPEDHLLALHVDRGPLDARLIGGSVGLSGYQPNHDSTEDTEADGSPGYLPGKELVRCWLGVANALWTDGATLAYAGNWKQDYAGQLMQELVDALTKLPSDPSRAKRDRAHPYPRLQSFQRVPGRMKPVVAPDEVSKLGLQVLAKEYISKSEQRELTAWQVRSIERFRQRLAVVESCVARFAVGGATRNHGGRMPGIAEEVMLALAAKQPVYLAGGFLGATLDIGSLMGMAEPRTGETPPSLRSSPPEEEAELDSVADKLRPSPWTTLPVTQEQVVQFFRSHALGSSGWIDNGLTPRENRELFSSRKPDEVASLVRRGMTRLFDR